MKNGLGNWLGQHIWQFISRFRNKVYLEDVDTGTTTDVLVREADGEVTTVSGSVIGGVNSVDETTSGTSTGTPIVVNPTTGTVLVQSMAFNGASNIGHVPAGGTSSTYLEGDGGWGVPIGTTYSAMTTSTLGLGRLRYATGATPTANAQTTTAERTYGVTENSSNQLVVNVPWLRGSGDVDSVSAQVPSTSTGDILSISPTTGAVVVEPHVYGGTTNIGAVPTGGSESTFLRGDATWVTPTNTNNLAFHQYWKCYGVTTTMGEATEYGMDAPNGNNEHKFNVDLGTSVITTISPKNAVRCAVMVIPDDDTSFHAWSGWVYGNVGATVTLRLYSATLDCEGDNANVAVCKIVQEIEISCNGNTKPFCFNAELNDDDCTDDIGNGDLIIPTAELDGDGTLSFVASSSLIFKH